MADKTEFYRRLKTENGSSVMGLLKVLCWNYRDIFAKHELDLGLCSELENLIQLTDNVPVYKKQFPIPLANMNILKQHVEEMLARGLIERSRSVYNSPVFVVPKKSGKHRIVIDLRAINAKTRKDFYSIKDIRQCLEKAGEAQGDTFTTIDLQKGFWQQPLAKESRQFCSFTVPGVGSFQPTVSPMGGQTSPAAFSALTDRVVGNISGVTVYIDDILISTKGQWDHLDKLREVFDQLRSFNLKISLDKSEFLGKSVKFLGYQVDKHGFKPAQDKLEAVRDTLPPTTVKAIR